MPYIYRNARKLEGKPKILNKKSKENPYPCALLIQHYVNPGQAVNWRRGTDVRGNGGSIREGTAIATFVGDRYQNKRHDNHVAFYLEEAIDGIVVIEQFDDSINIQKRRLAFKGKRKDGQYADPSNNGDAFSVLESIYSENGTAIPSVGGTGYKTIEI